MAPDQFEILLAWVKSRGRSDPPPLELRLREIVEITESAWGRPLEFIFIPSEWFGLADENRLYVYHSGLPIYPYLVGKTPQEIRDIFYTPELSADEWPDPVEKFMRK